MSKMLLGHGTQLSYSSGNDFVKRNVFNCLLKEKREDWKTEGWKTVACASSHHTEMVMVSATAGEETASCA